jgi:hypothetical protein
VRGIKERGRFSGHDDDEENKTQNSLNKNLVS